MPSQNIPLIIKVGGLGQPITSQWCGPKMFEMYALASDVVLDDTFSIHYCAIHNRHYMSIRLTSLNLDVTTAGYAWQKTYIIQSNNQSNKER